MENIILVGIMGCGKTTISKLLSEKLNMPVIDMDEYLEKKNMYLRRQDYNHPSFNVYVETVNQVFNKYFD